MYFLFRNVFLFVCFDNISLFFVFFVLFSDLIFICLVVYVFRYFVATCFFLLLLFRRKSAVIFLHSILRQLSSRFSKQGLLCTLTHHKAGKYIFTTLGLGLRLGF